MSNDLSDVKLWHFTLQELYKAADFYADSTTDQKDNAEVRAAIRAFLSWFEDGWNHQPDQEELDVHYKSIAEPYKGQL